MNHDLLLCLGVDPTAENAPAGVYEHVRLIPFDDSEFEIAVERSSRDWLPRGLHKKGNPPKITLHDIARDQSERLSCQRGLRGVLKAKPQARVSLIVLLKRT
jgi:hypothetical protein